MPKSTEWLWRTYQILRRTDYDHPIQNHEICQKLELYGEPPGRKTIGNYIKDLIDLSEKGLIIEEVEEHDEKPHAYYVNHSLIDSEIKMLSDAIASSSFIYPGHRQQLLRKLGELYNGDENSIKRFIENIHFYKEEHKDYNFQTFTNIEQLTEAIEQKKKVQFTYLAYNTDKKLVPYRDEDEGRKVVNPYKIVWRLSYYYLFCTNLEGEHPERFLRIDRMKDIQILDEPCDPIEGVESTEEYIENQVFMFGGENETVEFRCDNSIVNQVVDFFGDRATFRKVDEDHFDVKVRTSQSNIRYWILQYITSINNIRPESLRNQVLTDLRDALKRNEES
ncbi:helix-turn-helix transcriptional regulator [Alkalibacillus aidingensis]|uniref:helix-turn-helix transcriptional regulator n=1 Tax=Alkalibacillus aidingensis TaxID=2747607 RepID=UPI0016616CC9|nr:WYL domain-containing protein [Alkalibacillus aidingensis]